MSRLKPSVIVIDLSESQSETRGSEVWQYTSAANRIISQPEGASGPSPLTDRRTEKVENMQIHLSTLYE